MINLPFGGLSAAEGTIDVASSHSVAATADRLENLLNERGMTVFQRIDHARGAAGVGIDLRDTQLIIFGNPMAGSPLMECRQTIALDLPQKALIWEDESGRVWISYNDPAYLQRRHNVRGCEEAFTRVRNALSGFVEAAAGP